MMLCLRSNYCGGRSVFWQAVRLLDNVAVSLRFKRGLTPAGFCKGTRMFRPLKSDFCSLREPPAAYS